MFIHFLYILHRSQVFVMNVSTTPGWPVLGQHRGACFVLKLGGRPLSDPEVMNNLAFDLALLRQEGVRVVIVHGGGPQLSELSGRLGLETRKVNGRRVTDRETLRLAKMVFSGEVSTNVVAALRRHGVSGVGLSGVDGDLIDAHRRPPVELLDRETSETGVVDFGYVGDIGGINPSVLNVLMDQGFVPVIASLGADASGEVLNINADTVAAEVAIALGAEKLILMSDVPGLLRDLEDRDTRIPEMTTLDARDLLSSGVVVNGMLPKLEGAIRTIEAGTPHVHLIDGHTPHALLDEVSQPGSRGTLVTAPAAVSLVHGAR
jgi:acetylglutamate kinase